MERERTMCWHYRHWVVLPFMLGALLGGCGQQDDVLVGPNWETVRNLKSGAQSFHVATSGRETLRLGDTLNFVVTSAQTGRLWVLQVDSHDQVNVLYPNENVADNTIMAGQPLSIPPADAGWTLEASEPLGKSLVAFIVVVGDVNLDEELQRRDLGQALRTVMAAPAWGATSRVIEVGETQR